MNEMVSTVYKTRKQSQYFIPSQKESDKIIDMV